MVDTCTVYYLFFDEREKTRMIYKRKAPNIPKAETAVPTITLPCKKVSACEI